MTVLPLTYPDLLTFSCFFGYKRRFYSYIPRFAYFFYFSGYRRQFSSYIPRFAYFFLFSRVKVTVFLLHTLICLLFSIFPGMGDGFPLTYPDLPTFSCVSGYKRRFPSYIPKFAYFFLFSRVWATVFLLHTQIRLLFPVFLGIGNCFPASSRQGQTRE